MNKLQPLILLPFLGYFWLAAGVFAAGLFYPGYDHLSQYMSELGATGTTHGTLVNLVVFVGAELWIAVFVALAFAAVPGNAVARTGLILTGIYTALLTVAALQPCDFGCRPETPSQSQIIHSGAGLAAYITGLCGLALTSIGVTRRIGVWPVILLLTGLGLFFGTVLSQDLAGLFQRLLETLIYLWMLSIGFVLTRASQENRLA